MKLLTEHGKLGLFCSRLRSNSPADNRTADLYRGISGVVAFIAGHPVRPVGSGEDQYLATWYKENSLVFVSSSHQLWGKDRTKLNKKYGTVIRCEETDLQGMVLEKKQRVFDFISETAGFAQNNEQSIKSNGAVQMPPSRLDEDVAMSTEV